LKVINILITGSCFLRERLVDRSFKAGQESTYTTSATNGDIYDCTQFLLNSSIFSSYDWIINYF